MRRDGREVPAGTNIETDVCIIGGGVVGIVLAREFARRSLGVCIVESGGTEPEEATQQLADGKVVGEPTNDPITTRQRQFGGTANLWDSRLGDDVIGLRCGPLDEVDFEQRAGVPNTGWPFDKTHLDPYYERAQQICHLGPYRYDADAWSSADAPLFELDPSTIVTSVWQFGPQEPFLGAYLSELERSHTVTALLHANVTEIVANPAGSAVTGVKVATLHGNTFRVSAHTVVLAAGGLENPRLLLLSNSVVRKGLGNDHDLVGRYFMEHPFVLGGRLVPRDRSVLARSALFDVRRQKGTVVMAKLGLTQHVLREEGLLNSCVMLLPIHGMHKPEAVDSFKLLLKSALRGQLPDRAGTHVREVINGLDFVSVSILRKLIGQKKLFPHIDWGPGVTEGGGWSLLPDAVARYSAFDAWMLTEQPPVPENRITLGAEQDALGCRKLEVHWHWDATSRRSILRTERLLADSIHRSGFGRLDIRLDGDEPYLQYPAQHHHLGTTRMHASPHHGVVDEHGRVHGMANLYVGGGSVFPTGGYINPTLTIVALALRLADHLIQHVERPMMEVGIGS
jgi:choline dehydrogenase-like flavoprotein